MEIFTVKDFQKSSYVIALALLMYVVMCRDFNNGICSSGKILVLQYYLEIKVPKMVSKIIYMPSKHQAGVKILFC